MKIKFKKDCTFNGKTYEKNSELEITKEIYYQVWKLNEHGYIYPVNYEKYKRLKNKLKIGEE